jgi:NADPH-dependent 2,4-dienoyl-CoA reductase/sulfur reductase-like enzyme/bacterioferritin-associated ferredoxin
MELPRSDSFQAGTVAQPDTLALLEQIADLDTPKSDPVVVVGGGPAGLRVAQELTQRGLSVVLLNAERWAPYNRVKLTPFLAGEVQIGRVYQDGAFAADACISKYTGHTVVSIDRDNKTVTTQFGRSWRYAKLVLCIGSHAFIPSIPGRDLSGVFRFRNFDDVERLVARAMRARRAVIIGGGLLGLEAARGMSLRRVPTVVVEHEHHLMSRQLDRAGGELLKSEIERLGLTVKTGCAVRSIEGAGRVERILLSTGETIDCDTVIICTGIRANTALASDAGLGIGRGITVNDQMRTSDPNIYAVGECAQHNDIVHGLVAPGFEQAAVAAADIAGEKADYRGSIPTTKLKVVGSDVFSMGDIEQLDQRTDLRSIAWHARDGAAYRRLAIRRWHLVGALGVGDWQDVSLIQQAVRDRALVLPWHSRRFARTGRLRPQRKPMSVTQWPAAATVCNCTGVTRGQLGSAISNGATDLGTLVRETSASSVCGSCRPLLQELLGGRAEHHPVFGARILAVSSIIAAVIALAAVFLPAWPYSSSVDAGMRLDLLWISGTWKQVTGFTLLGLAAIVAFLSIRKRIGFAWMGHYNWWRLVHGATGAATLAVLFIHTGFNLGNNLNQWLMVTFLLVAFSGSITGVITAREHKVLAAGKPSRRNPMTWIHIVALWPLPLLLGLHIMTVYAY